MEPARKFLCSQEQVNDVFMSRMNPLYNHTHYSVDNRFLTYSPTYYLPNSVTSW